MLSLTLSRREHIACPKDILNRMSGFVRDFSDKNNGESIRSGYILYSPLIC